MLEQRFWDKVTKTDTCWFWTGAKRTGYGMYFLNGSNSSAHRLSYIESKGEIPDGKILDHICMNRHCVNPAHLEAVDYSENTARGADSAKYPSSSKKSYLLYIHDPLFKLEPKKSQLVNNLLERHYHDTVGGKTQDEVHADIKRAQAALKSAKVPTQERYVQTPEGIVGPVSLKPKVDRFCKEGHAIPPNRDRCLGKGCKYS